MVVGWVDKIIIFLSHNIIDIDLAPGQFAVEGIADEEGMLAVCLQITPVLVAQVGGSLPVAQHLGAAHAADAAVIAGDENRQILALGQLLEDPVNRGMLKPGAGQGTVGGFIGSDLLQDGQVRAAVRQNIDKIDHNAEQRGVQRSGEILLQVLAFIHRDDLAVARLGLELQSQQAKLIIEQLALVAVAAVIVILALSPHLRIALLQFAGQQTAENRVPGKRSGGGQDAEVIIFLNGIVIVKITLHRQPLIQAHTVDHHKHHLVALGQLRVNVFLDDVIRQGGALFFVGIHPVDIIAFDIFTELHIAFPALVVDNLAQFLIRQRIQIDIPGAELVIDLDPVLRREMGHQFHGDLVQLLGVIAGKFFLGDIARFQDFLSRAKDLAGIDRLGEVIVDLRPDGILHQALFLAFGDHDDWEPRADLLDLGQGGQAVLAGHHLV